MGIGDAELGQVDTEQASVFTNAGTNSPKEPSVYSLVAAGLSEIVTTPRKLIRILLITLIKRLGRPHLPFSHTYPNRATVAYKWQPRSWRHHQPLPRVPILRHSHSTQHPRRYADSHLPSLHSAVSRPIQHRQLSPNRSATFYSTL
jgi:hypothetical protein